MNSILKNSRVFLVISIFNAVFLFVFALLRLHLFHINFYLRYGIDIISEITIILSRVYLLALVKLKNERKLIWIGFYISIFISVITYLIDLYLFATPSYHSISISINNIAALGLIYLTIILFLIKDVKLQPLFRILAFSYLVTNFISLIIIPIIPFLTDLKTYSEINHLIGFVRLIPALAIIYIIKESIDLLQDDERRNNQPLTSPLADA